MVGAVVGEDKRATRRAETRVCHTVNVRMTTSLASLFFLSMFRNPRPRIAVWPRS